MLLELPVKRYSQLVVAPTSKEAGVQVPELRLTEPIVVGAAAVIFKLAVGLDPRDVKTFLFPIVAPIVGTLAQTNLAVIVPLFVIAQLGLATDPGTVTLIPPDGSK